MKTDVELLSESLAANPDDQTAAGMLFDAFQESGLSDVAARWEVTRIQERARSTAWLQEFAKEFTDKWEDKDGVTHVDHEIRYEELLSILENCVKNDEGYCLPFETPAVARSFENLEEMWHHFEIVTGMNVKDPSNFVFRCAC
jgi:hypothetical protein